MLAIDSTLSLPFLSPGEIKKPLLVVLVIEAFEEGTHLLPGIVNQGKTMTPTPLGVLVEAAKRGLKQIEVGGGVDVHGDVDGVLIRRGGPMHCTAGDIQDISGTEKKLLVRQFPNFSSTRYPCLNVGSFRAEGPTHQLFEPSV